MGVGSQVYSMLKNTQKNWLFLALSTMRETLVCLSRFLSRSNQVLCTESSCELAACMMTFITLAFVLYLFSVWDVKQCLKEGVVFLWKSRKLLIYEVSKCSDIKQSRKTACYLWLKERKEQPSCWPLHLEQSITNRLPLAVTQIKSLWLMSLNCLGKLWTLPCICKT